MSARELAEPYPYVTNDEDVVHAARLMALHKLPALLVVDADAQPYAIVPGTQFVERLMSDDCGQEDPPTAGSVGNLLDAVPERIAGRTVADWLPPGRVSPATVGPDASIRQIAALMARTHSPLVAVVEHDGDQAWLAGAVTAARLMERLIGGT